jgi:hypothetical protein
MWEAEIPQPTIVEGGAVFARMRQPGGDRRVAMAKVAHRCSNVQSFGQRGQQLRNALGRGFEAVERGHPEGRSAGY